MYISIYSNREVITTLRLFVHIVGHIEEGKLMAGNWTAKFEQLIATANNIFIFPVCYFV